MFLCSLFELFKDEKNPLTFDLRVFITVLFSSPQSSICSQTEAGRSEAQALGAPPEATAGAVTHERTEKNQEGGAVT